MPELARQERTLESSIDLGLEVLAEEQSADGAWKGDYGGPLFLVPIYVAGLHVLGAAPGRSVTEGFITYVRGHQNEDGGWGLDLESASFVFTSVLNYVALRLLGVDPNDSALVRAASNRDAIGSRVHIVAAGTGQWQEVRGGGSYLSQNDLRVHFGLAGAAVVDRLDVRWPNGRVEHWQHLAADRVHTLSEGTGK